MNNLELLIKISNEIIEGSSPFVNSDDVFPIGEGLVFESFFEIKKYLYKLKETNDSSLTDIDINLCDNYIVHSHMALSEIRNFILSTEKNIEKFQSEWYEFKRSYLQKY